ncbi:hypothetical protein K490DRAFT_76311 [Saccharata proteae CBS 121410]|uniref:RNA ligase/cyclic nucleotide phosphodiesterase n=1 Tax=Saccharata proteae CBS 121410 TaxID=1314787 RepID=A0A9P4HQI6_9PEZI|nr:hypothetical protein K490DRAFT_76311 [Saccharata proteae CBS 121410]
MATTSRENPYDVLLSAIGGDDARVQEHYSKHRVTRNEQQKAKFLDPSFAGVTPDPILQRLEDPTIEPGYVDPRHCLVFWARPTRAVKDLVARIQTELREVVPNLWLMPQASLHLTAMEITHTRTEEEISALVSAMQKHIPDIVNYTLDHRARLVKPMLGFDASAIALSFVPAAGGEGLRSSARRTAEDDNYTYHHLRRDLFGLCEKTGVEVKSRYVVASAHLTVGRFIQTGDVEDEEGRVDRKKVGKLVEAIEAINEWLGEEFWPGAEGIKDGGEWVVGEGTGLDCRRGALWYGAGGETIMRGQGF